MDNVNGWLCIREGFREEDEDTKLLEEIVERIRSKIDSIDVVNEYYDLRSANGEFYLQILIDHNRLSDRPYEFLEWIIKIAPGSFGLIYFLDTRYSDNHYKVLRVAKGEITEFEDPFLSPQNPTIEE